MQHLFVGPDCHRRSSRGSSSGPSVIGNINRHGFSASETAAQMEVDSTSKIG